MKPALNKLKLSYWIQSRINVLANMGIWLESKLWKVDFWSSFFFFSPEMNWNSSHKAGFLLEEMDVAF